MKPTQTLNSKHRTNRISVDATWEAGVLTVHSCVGVFDDITYDITNSAYHAELVDGTYNQVYVYLVRDGDNAELYGTTVNDAGPPPDVIAMGITVIDLIAVVSIAADGQVESFLVKNIVGM